MRVPLSFLKRLTTGFRSGREVQSVLHEHECRENPRALSISFIAEPEAVGVVRRRVGTYLRSCGRVQLGDAAQLCVSELVTNVVLHVGVGTPITLRVSLLQAGVRIEVTDHVPSALPLLRAASDDAETGRGLALLGAFVDRWGVTLTRADKSVWCEFGETPETPSLPPSRHLERAEVALRLYTTPQYEQRTSLLERVAGEENAISLIADVLHWLAFHGRDLDDVLDQAQTHFEAEAS